ncbi:MAG: hypothetical protein LUG44_02725, partial [Clostridiales bacterium]|nr:hypothetical protein [Clostridiales bacterium]
MRFIIINDSTVPGKLQYKFFAFFWEETGQFGRPPLHFSASKKLAGYFPPRRTILNLSNERQADFARFPPRSTTKTGGIFMKRTLLTLAAALALVFALAGCTSRNNT